MDGESPRSKKTDRRTRRAHQRSYEPSGVVVSLTNAPPDASLLNSTDFELYIRHRVMPYRRLGSAISVVCVSEDDLAAFQAHSPTPMPIVEVALTSRAEFDGFIQQAYNNTLSRHAVDGLFETQPEFSARYPISRPTAAIVFALIACVAVTALSICFLQ